MAYVRIYPYHNHAHCVAESRSPGAYELLTSTEQRPARSILETLLFVMLIASFTITVIHKAVTGTLLFLMQVRA